MIDGQYLRELRRKYSESARSTHPDPLADVVRKYQEFKKSNLLDCAALASQLTVEDFLHGSNDPLVAEAVTMTSPNFDVEAFHSQEEWTGFISAVKGKYFELLVAERLEAGEQVGDVLLPHGFHAELARSLTQPGWDIRITDPNGDVSTYLQLKASESTSYIREALERYPDIKILATSEVAGHIDNQHMVIDSGISETDLRDVVQLAVGHHESLLDAFWDSFHPLVPLLLIAGTQGYKLIVGKASVREAVELSIARGTRALLMVVTASTVKMLGGGFFAIPAAWATGAWFTRAQTIDGLIAASRRSSQKLVAQASHYRQAFAV